MSSIITQNRNRAHAVKQLQRGLKKASHTEEHVEDGVGDVQLLGSIANSLIYIGDILKDMNDHFNHPVKEIKVDPNGLAGTDDYDDNPNKYDDSPKEYTPDLGVKYDDIPF
jgi:hypothetical protein